MKQRLLDLGRTANISTTTDCFSLGPIHFSGTNRTTIRHDEVSSFLGATAFKDFHYFWNDISAFFKERIIANFQSKSSDLVFVMKCSPADGSACKSDRFVIRHGCQSSRSSNLDKNISNLRSRLPGRKRVAYR